MRAGYIVDRDNQWMLTKENTSPACMTDLAMEYVCPNCEASGMRVFYGSRDIPIHSCVMLNDREAATDYPKRDLSLGFCRTCGFISNVVFDSTAYDCSGGYEEQQSFSPCFRAFQSNLIARLIDRYDLRDKDIVEIGCGKGDFLNELCEVGGNRGVGIDPACDPERVGTRDAGRVRFIADVYSEAYADLPCDFLCCRHTLEHIHATDDFIRLVRKVIGDRKEMVVFFEVPDVGRVLREQAFWDVYYEHCSYFSPGSLARVFRANRFEVIELAKDYDEQYVVIVVRPLEGPAPARLREEDDLEKVARQVDAFAVSVEGQISGWRSRITEFGEAGKRIAVWGSGSKCVSFLNAAGLDDGLDAVVDINPHRHGKFLPGSGRQIVAPEALRALCPDVIIVMNPIYLEEIQQAVDRMGLCAELLVV